MKRGGLMWMFLIVFFVFGGCPDPEGDDDSSPPSSQTPVETDIDADGFNAPGDCDDENPAVYPGADEVCDGLDNDCDDAVDDDPTEGTLYYSDLDGDGYGGEGTGVASCEPPEGHVDNGGDCDDSSPSTYPGAPEVCDGADNDCDQETDEEVSDGTVYYQDQDYDGYGGADDAVLSCERPPGFVDNEADCNDSDSDTYPGADELCDAADNDCDDEVDEEAIDGDTFYPDEDEDGYGIDENALSACELPLGYAEQADDCDDADPATHPGAEELCTDPVDRNCDGSIGYADADGDGHVACEECNDADPEIYPGALELCDGIDNDCDENSWAGDGETDDDDDGALKCADCDDDNPDNFPGNAELCDGQDNDCDAGTSAGEGESDEDGDGALLCADCDDADPANYPDNKELCDGQDNDCDEETWAEGGEADEDGDGALACEDCDDDNSDNFPGNPEICDGQDNDCDARTDEDTVPMFFQDWDGDGFGNPDITYEACNPPPGYVSVGDDCDDDEITVYPDAPELCDGLDNDCDEGTWAGDGEGDADGDDTLSCEDCDDGDPANFPGNPETCDGQDNDCDEETAAEGGEADVDEDGAYSCADCDDRDAANFPSNPEVCDGGDNDCDGAPSNEEIDDDGDGVTECDNDCDDEDPANFPSNPEVCDGQDNDCDGQPMEDEVDGDGDGQPVCQGDCDDEDPANFTGNSELCDGQDNNCDANLWPDEVDDDEDGFTDCGLETEANPSGLGDCDDDDPNSYPGADEVCDGVDNDCDGVIDPEELDDDGDGQAECEGDCDDGDPENFAGNVEGCDGQDNDCDGEADNYAELDVYDGSLEPGKDLRYQYSPVETGTGFIKANWTEDPLVVAYQAAIGTSPGDIDVLDWTNVGTATSYMFEGLDLTGAWEDASYYVTVRPAAGENVCPASVSNGVGIAEAETWTGNVGDLRPPDALGGYSVDWPQEGADAVYGEHFFETLFIPEEVTVYVQGWGKVQDVQMGVSADDAAVLEPADGWLTLWANDIEVLGTITASGRGYGGGGGGGGTCGSTAARGYGGAGGLGGNGGLVQSSSCSGAGGGGGGSPGGLGGWGYSSNTNGGNADMFAAGGGGSGQWGGGNSNTKGGDSGQNAGGGPAGPVGDIGMTGGSREVNGDAPGGAGEFTTGGGGGGSDYATGASGGAGGGGGYGAGGGGGNESWGTGGGGGGSGGNGGGNGGDGLVGAGPFGGAGGAEQTSGGRADKGQDGGYAEAEANGDATEDDSLRLGSGGGGGGASQSQSAGGGGAAGGGYIKLRAYFSLHIGPTARVLANGAGGGGGAGDDNSGRIGGVGGAGGGGGLLLEANEIFYEASGPNVSARGGNNQLGNGGTIKLFYETFSGDAVDPDYFGRVFDPNADTPTPE